MRIAIAGTEFFRSSGGIQRINRMLLRVLDEFARLVPLRVQIFSLNDDPKPPQEIPAGAEWHAAARRKPVFAAKLTAAFARAKPDLLLFTHVRLLYLAPMARALSPRTPHALLAHGYEVWEPLPKPLRGILRGVPLIVCPSTFTREKLIAVHGLKSERVQVLPHGLDAEWELPEPAEIDRTGRTILCVSRLEREDRAKGVEDLLKAMPAILMRVPPAQLEVVGDGDDRTHLEALAAQLRIAEHVQFLGGLSDEPLRRAYSTADVFALPSRLEGFGMVFIEAMAHQLPVVAARTGGAPDVVRDAETGILVPPGDISALASALSGLLLLSDERRAMGLAGRRRVEQNYLFSHFSSRWQRWLVGAIPEAVYLARHSAAFALGESLGQFE